MPELTSEERIELVQRLEKLHMTERPHSGYFQLGRFLVDCAPGAGVWVYRDDTLVFTSNIAGALVGAKRRKVHRDILCAARRIMVLDELADV